MSGERWKITQYTGQPSLFSHGVTEIYDSIHPKRLSHLQLQALKQYVLIHSNF